MSEFPHLVMRSLRHWLFSYKGIAEVKAEQDCYHSFQINCSLWTCTPSPGLIPSAPLFITHPSSTSSIIRREGSSFPQICFSFDSHAKIAKQLHTTGNQEGFLDYFAYAERAQCGLVMCSVMASELKSSPPFTVLTNEVFSEATGTL